MCKHILFNDFQISDLDTLKHFASLSAYERDGYGAILRTWENKIEAYKSLSLAEFYITLTERLTRGDISTLVVHHRTSTNQDGLEYAHPFEFDGNWLTHNGVVSVQGQHDTTTKNDSEALLHHLIKTGYETKSIQGYFSCFVLNSESTAVLVDAIAPIYTDGRVYSSHKLNDNWDKIELQKITLALHSGEILAQVPIDVTESTYGRESRALSLGAGHNDFGGMSYDIPINEGYPDTPKTSQDVADFFDLISDNDLSALYSNFDRQEIAARIQELGYSFGLDLDDHDLDQIQAYL